MLRVRPASLAPALVALAVGACGRVEGATPADAAPPVVPTAAPQVCAPHEGRCDSDDAGETCAADGLGYKPVRCGEGSICVAGECAELPSDTDREGWARPRGSGWLNRWAMEAPIGGKIYEPVVAALMAGRRFDGGSTYPTPAPLCSPSGLLRIPSSPVNAGTTYALLRGSILVARDQKVELWIGAATATRVFVAGHEVYAKPAPEALGRGEVYPAPLPDDERVKLELKAGATTVEVLVAQPLHGHAGLWIALRDEHAVPARAAFFAPAATRTKTCSDAELVDVTVRQSVVRHGFSLAIGAEWKGLGPRIDTPIAIEAGIVHPEKPRDPPTPVGSVTIEPKAPKALLELKPKKAGQRPLRLDVTVGEARASREVPVAYRGELHERVARLSKDVEKLLAHSDASDGDKESYRAHVLAMVDALESNDTDVTWMERETSEAERFAVAFAKGEDPYREATGVVRRAYRSKLDGSLQRYLLFVPRAAHHRKMPLVVAIHGLNGLPGQALRTVVGEAPETENMNFVWAARHLPWIGDYGVMIAAPSGYGNSGQRLPGEDDVLRVISEVKSNYMVDDERVTMTGYSLGGTTSFVVPLHYPDVFAGSAPLCGYPDFPRWTSIQKSPHRSWEEVLIAKRYIANYAENGLHLPLHIVHGELDGPERSAVIADRYRELRYASYFDKQKEEAHDIWNYAYEKGRMMGWLRARRRHKSPAHVRLVSAEYRYDKADWVRLVARRQEAAFASIDAQWKKDAGEVRVETTNVEAFGLDLDAPGAKRAHVVVDGKDLGKARHWAWVSHGKNGFELVDEDPTRAGDKKAGVAGPLDDLQRHRALVVYGTAKPDEAKANRMVAEHFAAVEHSTVRYPIKSDVEVTPDELADQSIVLVGRPETNKVTAELLAALPVSFEKGAVVLRGKRYAKDDVAVSLIYPNPKNADEYLVLHAGTTLVGTLAARHLPELLPDWVVYDGRIAVRTGGILFNDRPAIDGGFFDRGWQ